MSRIARPGGDGGGDLPPVSITISPDVSDLLNAHGGLIVEIRGRSALVEARPLEMEQDDATDPLVAYLASHPLGRAAATDDTASIILQCDALERFQVPMGTKAIAIWMWRRWT